MADIRNMVKQDDRSEVGRLFGRLVDAFKKAGYDLQIRNEAWLRPNGVRADDYIHTKEGTRYRGALVIRLVRGSHRVEVHLTSRAPYKFRITHGRDVTELDHIDRGIVSQLKQMLDSVVEDILGTTLRLTTTQSRRANPFMPER